MRRRRGLWISIGVLGAGALTAGLAWFQPWKLWVDERVDEKLPAVALASVDPTANPAVPASPGAPKSAPSTDLLLSRGTLISQEHPTSGQVSVVQRPDGSRVLAIAHLNTSNGPDLHIWLTDAPVRKTNDGWSIFDDGKYLSLGTLKGNIGNQVYNIPRSADLATLTSVTVWCARFDVSFGAAELVPLG
jgi:hypothetical protein